MQLDPVIWWNAAENDHIHYQLIMLDILVWSKAIFSLFASLFQCLIIILFLLSKSNLYVADILFRFILAAG